MAQAEAAREDGIDFVVVVTPNVSHYSICKAFLEAGIHVSCDKPLAVSVAQAEELERLANEKGLLFLVTYTYMGHVTAKHAREIIKAGELGISAQSSLNTRRVGWPTKASGAASRANGAAIPHSPAIPTAWATWERISKTL